MTRVVALLLVALSCSSFLGEKLSREELQTRVDKFNSWYSSFNPNEKKLKANLSKEGKIHSVATDRINTGEFYLSLEAKHALCNNYSFTPEVEDVIVPFAYTQNDSKFANVMFAFMFELSKPDSEFKPYFDILPREPSTFAYNYWNHSDFIEKELAGLAAKRKMIEYKLSVDRLVETYFSFAKEHTEVLSPSVFTRENLEWAILTLNTKLMQLDGMYCLVPMADLFQIGQSKSGNDREFDLKSTEGIVKVDAIQSFLPGESIVENLNWNNSNLFVYHGATIKYNTKDCALLNFSFSENKDDPLAEKRKFFFKKQFDFQGELYNFVEECLSETNLFPRRLLFFFYTSILDEKELGQEEPKTTDLEFDRIVIEEGINQMKAILALSKTNLEEDNRKLQAAQSNMEKTVYSYVIEQKIQVQRIINLYQEKVDEIGREDVL